MENAAEQLEWIRQKIKTRLGRVSDALDEGSREIDQMHDYYWENYTEMDEYGYENFDNQQALLIQVNANVQQRKERQTLRRMLDTPYFGRVDFCYDGEEDAEPFYIGISNFQESSGSRPLIFDWRAPVSALFYDYDRGPAAYEAPAGLITGEVTGKGQYKIRRGRLIYAFESDVKIDDEVLGQALGGQGDTKLKAIVQTIQKEQNAIIRNRKDRILVIQGAAGSGKTSVALHRVAYLLYHDREHLKASNVLILSPGSAFSDYISHILPELGEENIREMTFDLFAYRELKGVIADCGDRCDEIERMLCGGQDLNAFEEKQEKAFLMKLRGYCLDLESELVEFRDVSIGSFKKTGDELAELFYEKFTDYPLFTRMDEVEAYVIDEYETLTGRTLAGEPLDQLHQKFLGMFSTRDLYELYSRFLEQEGYRPLPEAAPEMRILPYADLYPMLYLKYQLESRRALQDVRHLVIDEMQDYSYIQYRLLELLFKCRMTILGDRLQTIGQRRLDVTRFLPAILGRDLRVVEMKKSYRNTVEIATYAAALVGDTDLDLFERHGAPVEEKTCGSFREGLEMLAEEIISAPEESETMALLTYTQAEADEAYRFMKEHLADAGIDAEKRVTLIDRNKDRFRSGLTVTTFYFAKGLEFERVWFMDTAADPDPLHIQAKYIAATRAMHRLTVLDVR